MIVEQVGGGDRRLAVIELGEGDLGVGVDEGLLVDADHDPLHVADVESIMGSEIALKIALELAMSLIFALVLIQREELAFGKLQALPGRPCPASSALSRFFIVSRS